MINNNAFPNGVATIQSEQRNNIIIEAMIIMASLATALALAWNTLPGRGNSTKDYLVRQGAVAIKQALDQYAASHGGVYPEDEKVAGGAARDVLIAGGHLQKYPGNPYERDARMKKASFDSPSAGNFSYGRNPEKTYEFHLMAYGASDVVYKFRTR
jgi:hypothetical protein